MCFRRFTVGVAVVLLTGCSAGEWSDTGSLEGEVETSELAVFGKKKNGKEPSGHRNSDTATVNNAMPPRSAGLIAQAIHNSLGTAHYGVGLSYEAHVQEKAESHVPDGAQESAPQGLMASVPPEVLQHIMSFLPAQDLAAASCVSQGFDQNAREPRKHHYLPLRVLVAVDEGDESFIYTYRESQNGHLVRDAEMDVEKFTRPPTRFGANSIVAHPKGTFLYASQAGSDYFSHAFTETGFGPRIQSLSWDSGETSSDGSCLSTLHFLPAGDCVCLCHALFGEFGRPALRIYKAEGNGTLQLVEAYPDVATWVRSVNGRTLMPVAFHPAGTLVFTPISNKAFVSSVSSYRGRWQESTEPAPVLLDSHDLHGGHYVGRLHAHPRGRFLYVETGTMDQSASAAARQFVSGDTWIVVFKIDLSDSEKDAELKNPKCGHRRKGLKPTLVNIGKLPRHWQRISAIDSDTSGRFLFVARSDGISVYSVDTQRLKHKEVEGSPFGAADVDWLAVHPRSNRLYALTASKKLLTFRFDETTGRLDQTQEIDLPEGVVPTGLVVMQPSLNNVRATQEGLSVVSTDPLAAWEQASSERTH